MTGLSVVQAPVTRVGVVLPAHNEGLLLGSCLKALTTSCAAATVPTSVVVVLDACTDDSESICERFGVPSIAIGEHNVGRARAAGMARVLASCPDPQRLWLATTDADTIVPPHWIARQLELADDGADAVLGVVILGPSGEVPTRLRRRFEARYGLARATATGRHPHVHGANLGIRASAYLRVGGFPPLAVHEDRHLVESLARTEGLRIVRSPALHVLTSARMEGRCAEGFAQHLRRIDDPGLPAGQVG